MRPSNPRVAWFLVLAAALVVPPRTMRAQGLERDPTAHVRYLGVNVVIGAAAATARAAVAGTSLTTALTRGLIGGSLVGAGMELIGAERAHTRLAGLQLAAVGTSISRNVDPEVSAFSDITLPFYPFYVRVRPGSPTPVTARLSLMSTVRLASVLTGAHRPRPDWGASLATGALVLQSPRWRLPSASCPPPCEGSFAQHNAGVIVYSASAGTDYDLGRTLAHETMHAVQHTRDVLTHAMPASDVALARLGRPGRAVGRFLVVDVFLPMRLIDEAESRFRGAKPRDSWYELEARAFAPGGELIR